MNSRPRLVLGVFLLLAAASAHAGSYLVTSTADTLTPGTLRQGIADANANVCTNPCTITFDPTLFATPQTINTTSSLSISANNVVIDGFANGVGTANSNAFGLGDNSLHHVTINGPSTTCCAVIGITGTGVVIRGLVIQDGLSGISVGGIGSATIAGCFIGTNTAGTASVPNLTGIVVNGTSPTATIGGLAAPDRNVISGNSATGIQLQSASNVVIGNYIGTSALGTTAVPNSKGVTVSNSSNSIGSTSLGNLISGNTGHGIEVTAGAGSGIDFNRIGTTVNGLAALPNGTGGILVGGGTPSGTVIGNSSSPNVISGNTGIGVEVTSSGGGTVISFNIIGLDAAQTATLPNTGVNVSLSGAGSGNNIISNAIAGSPSHGIAINGAQNTNINNNSIGYYAGNPYPNGGKGIYITAATGTTVITQNIIRNNVGVGVDVDGAIIGVAIKQNEFADNGGLGIDLHAGATDLGATPNDATDADNGTGNHSQNFPVVTNATVNGATGASTLSVSYTVDSSSVGTTAGIRVELFKADPGPTNPEGFTFVGAKCSAGNLITDSISIPGAGVAPNEKIVLTATSYSNAACTTINEGTSEFSPAATVAVQPGLVINTADSGSGSLRQAINDANAGACLSPCTITFNIPITDAGFAGNVFTIKPTSGLPTLLKDLIVLDGSTQTAFTGNTNVNGPEIVLNGALAPGAQGLLVGSNTAGQGSNLQIKHVVINGWGAQGIYVSGAAGVTNLKILGCYIGTDPSGTSAVANGNVGIYVQNNVTGMQVGSAAEGNIISGNNGDGIFLFGGGVTNTTVLGNIIGADRTKSAGIPNAGQGVLITQGSENNRIGGGLAGEANTIAYNTGNGVTVLTLSFENAIRFNSIHSNVNLGINLSNDGVTGNDTGDGDGNPNGLQNYPVLTSAIFNGTNTTINGTLNSLPNTTFDVDWYSNTTLDGTGFGEGQTYLATSTWTTDVSGNAAVSISLPGNLRSSNVVATASRVNGAIRETSEFSAPAPNNPPIANNDTPPAGNEDTPQTFDPRANDTDPENGPLQIISYTQPSPTAGTVTCTTASCTFTPTPNYNGPASFTYNINDDMGATATATVSLTVTSVNDPPVANPDTLGTSEDTPNSVAVLTNDTDIDGPSPLSVTGSTNGTKGTVSCTAGGACTYTPNLNQNGADSFTYTVSDGASVSTGTVNVTITAVNDPPVANPDTLGTNEDTSNTVNVLTNDTDVDGPALSVTGNTNGTKGTASCAPTGACTYTPNLNQTGTDSFTYTVTDGTTPVTGTVNVTISPVNDPPVANPDTLTTNMNTANSVNVLTNDTDVDGPTLSVTGSTNGTKGTVSCAPTGNCTYSPNLNQTGADSFTYTVSDGTTPVTGNVSVTINSTNTPPNAAPDFAETTQGNPVSFNALFNDSDPNGDPISILSNTQPSNGSATCQPGGTCTYSPAGGFTGVDSFSYTIKDTSGATATATVTINVKPCPVAPNTFTPANAATGVATTGKLFWNSVGAQSYSVYLGRADRNGCSQPFASTDNTFVDYSNLEGNTTYAWRVEAISAGCPIVIGSCNTFTTRANCNTGVTLVKPLGGTQTSPIEFEWLPIAGATEYTVFAKSGTGNFAELGKTASTKLTAPLIPDGTSQWFVVASVPGCGNVQSATAAFNLCNRPGIPLPRVVGEATSTKTYSVEWDVVPNAIRYEVDEATNPSFTGAATTSTTSNSVAFKHDATDTPLAFYYRVRAFSACTQLASDHSPTVRIVIIPLPKPTDTNQNTNVPAGSTEVVVQQVFIPGVPGVTAFFNAIADRPWLSVRPPNGVLPPEGIILEVIADPRTLPNGTFTATVIVTITTPTVEGIRGNGTSTTSKPISISLVTPVTPVQNKLTPSGDSLIIPSVGHLDGINSHWQSDIRVTNIGLQSAKYALTFTPSGGTSTGIQQTTITVGPGETTALDDIIKNWYGIGSLGDSANGMLEIRSADNQPLTAVASSRTYNVTANGTLGQFIPALPFSGFVGKALQASQQPTSLSMQQISQSSLYRTNVGIVEASGSAASVLMSVFNAAGTKLSDIPLDLKGGEQRQLNSILAANNITLADGRIEVKVTGGDGKVTAYASVVDNNTNDPLLVSGVPTNVAGSSKYVLPGVADLTNALANWRTDMRIFNTTFASQNASLTLHPLGGGTPLHATVTLQPGEVRTLDDVVKSLFKVSNVGGAVHVETTSQANLVVTGRTYNQTSEGTFGQFIEAVTPEKANGLGNRTLHVLQVEDSTRYRTNLGIAEVSGRDVMVEVQIVLPDSKVTPTITFPMAANEFRQLSVIRDLNLGNVYNARLAVRVVDGQGRITAYGSVVDMTTQDPTYVPAQ